MGTDREQIIDVAVRYCTALDRRDWKLLDRCFLADAIVVYPEFGELKGIPALTKFLGDVLDPLDATQHMVSNFTVEATGDGTATLVCYLHSQHVRHAAPGGPFYVVAGTYHDDFVRTDAGWLISKRELTATWIEGNRGVLG
jgi:3-phenylpropionate/cinnamic acid dioxygenase small subunit